MSDDFKQSVLEAADRPEVRAAVEKLYAAVQGKIDERRPLCIVSGRCCRFEEFGHRLFVTTIEMAAFVHELNGRVTGGPPMSFEPKNGGDPSATQRIKVQLPLVWDGTGCPYQINKLCSVHAFRPFGCRMFFCDATSTEWQNQQYERFHAELKQLHETHKVPYFYIEWRQALRECLSPE